MVEASEAKHTLAFELAKCRGGRGAAVEAAEARALSTKVSSEKMAAASVRMVALCQEEEEDVEFMNAELLGQEADLATLVGFIEVIDI